MSTINMNISNRTINALRAQRDALKAATPCAYVKSELARIENELFAVRRAYHTLRASKNR